jgi:hypothetical protein
MWIHTYVPKHCMAHESWSPGSNGAYEPPWDPADGQELFAQRHVLFATITQGIDRVGKLRTFINILNVPAPLTGRHTYCRPPVLDRHP